ncbi:MAG TPA: cytochrome c biogenesis protein CcdA [Vicinamibacterales bacterium]|nr:cytochrome c biogenesis protein CcdA [Vicinamibacterales bacterium]
MRALVTLLLVTALAACGAPPRRVGDVPAEVTPLVERTTTPAGSPARLALHVSVPEGLHLQSNRPRDPSLIATTLTFDPPAGVAVTEVVFPPSTDFLLEGDPNPLAVFEHEFVIGIQLAVDASAAPGSFALPAELRYQACDDRVCFRARSLVTSWTFEVAAGGEPSPARHADVFGAIAFGTGEPAVIEPIMMSVVPAASSAPVADAGLARLANFTIEGRDDGYLGVPAFLQFIRNAEAGIKPRGWFEDRGLLAILLITAVGGLALNLTPCVLPMIPINLAIIGAGAQAGRRSRGFGLGATYGLAMALVYGVLGLVVILAAGNFGTINASPWFNLGIAVLFVVLALAMFDVIAIDFSRWSSRIQFDEASRGTYVLAFSMGSVAALLAGACVAPVVIQVIVFASDQYARGVAAALALPFVLGLGMALPWPIAGAGIASLPKPGAWMAKVKYAMGVFILATAAYYGYLAWELFANRWVDPASVRASVARQVEAGWHASLDEGLAIAERDGTPVLIDLWATWCKNCLVMDETTLADPTVQAALSGYTKIKFQAEDLDASPARELMQHIDAYGLPAYVILKPRQ